MKYSTIIIFALTFLFVAIDCFGANETADSKSEAPAFKTATGKLQKFESVISKLEKESQSKKNWDEKWKVFHKTSRELSKIKEEGPRLSEELELQISEYSEVLSGFPDPADKKKYTCNTLVSQVKGPFIPRSGDVKSSEALSKAISMVDSLCK